MIADTIAACATVRATGLALHGPAVQKLRAILEAGRLLALVQRSDGARPLNNSTRGLTSYQFALKRAGISRPTANLWQRVAATPETDFERLIVEAQRDGHGLTVHPGERQACEELPRSGGLRRPVGGRARRSTTFSTHTILGQN